VIKKNKKFNFFLLGLFILNFLQAIFTPIIKDEAYYWSWAQHFAWGYFDHPPMVAFMIKVSSFFFSGRLGIRFITILLNVLLVKVIWELIPEKIKEEKNADRVFFMILLATPFFNIYGFITTPDAPLLFFGALYLLALTKIENKNNLLNTLFFGLTAALLIYSKLFGFIVIFLSILFKPGLLRKKTTYLSGIIALIFLTPYIYWQYNHDFITFNYHLFQRKSIGDFRFKFVSGYLLGTIGVLNPGFIYIIFRQLIKKKNLIINENVFMVRMFIGYILFFFIYSFRSWIEAHWVAFAIIPMVILLYTITVKNSKVYKTIKIISIISIVLLSLLRILITLNLPIKTEFDTQKKTYFNAIDKLANNRMVIFINSYQKASEYSYYTHKKSYSINNIYYRKNQYNLWDIENALKNKKVMFIEGKFSSFKDSIKLVTGDYVWYKKVDKFKIIGALKATFSKPLKKIDFNKEKQVSLLIKNPYKYNLELDKNNSFYELAIQLEYKKYKHIIPLRVKSKIVIKAKQKNSIVVSLLTKQIPKGEYMLSIIIKDKSLYYRQISENYKVQVKNSRLYLE